MATSSNGPTVNGHATMYHHSKIAHFIGKSSSIIPLIPSSCLWYQLRRASYRFFASVADPSSPYLSWTPLPRPFTCSSDSCFPRFSRLSSSITQATMLSNQHHRDV